MKLSAPFLAFKNFWDDLRGNPQVLYQSLVRYECDRSNSFPVGKLPLTDIFELVPDADSKRVTFEGIFEIPRFTRNLPREGERYTASTSLTDLYILALLASKHVTESILEVGTSYGQTALNLALNTPDKVQITTLDIQADNPSVGIAFRGHPVADRIKQVFSGLADLLPQLSPNSIDMIFIDGDHSYAAVLSDSIAALSLIRPGGVICWHDYVFMFRDDVVRALDELRSLRGIDIRRIAYTGISAAVIPA